MEAAKGSKGSKGKGSKGASKGAEKKGGGGGAKGAGGVPGGGAAAGGGASGAAASALQPCKFFGSAKGCSSEACPFSHDSPNSVAPCSFKQRKGTCDKGEACTFRHVPWTSADAARRHYASRDGGALELAMQRHKQLHRDGGGAEELGSSSASSKAGRHGSKGAALSERLKPEIVELQVEHEMQLETYGTTAMKMMAKMGYAAGGGLGKEGQGRTSLVGPALELERASQSTALGLGHYSGSARATVAERSARLADARAQKHRKIDEGGFTQHNLLSSDESSEGEGEHRTARDTQLRAA